MQKFWELFAQSIIMQSLLTAAIIGVYLYMVVVGRDAPQLLVDLVGLVVGFFFGSKVGYSQGANKAG